MTSAKVIIGKAKESQSICRELCREMDFRLLYDPVRKLFSIGMRVPEDQLDPSYYDLLASEARLTSFIAIANTVAKRPISSCICGISNSTNLSCPAIDPP